MVSITIAVCDDEKNIRENIMHLVKNLCEDCCVELFDSGNVLLSSKNDYAICFLDIQMPGIDGMEAARQIRKRQGTESKKDSVIIFITALKEYMEYAFDVRAFHYLVKPIDENKFKTVFLTALNDCRNIQVNAEKHILVKGGSSYHKLFLKDIFYIESRARKVIIHSLGGAMEYYEKMLDIENILGDSFFRCHRCYIVNMEHITQYSANTIWLKNGDEIFLAQKKYQEFVKTYMTFARTGGLIHG